jgi:hypothetical protein
MRRTLTEAVFCGGEPPPPWRRDGGCARAKAKRERGNNLTAEVAERAKGATNFASAISAIFAVNSFRPIFRVVRVVRGKKPPARSKLV